MRPMHTNSCLPSIGSRVDDDNYLSLSTDDVVSISGLSLYQDNVKLDNWRKMP